MNKDIFCYHLKLYIMGFTLLEWVCLICLCLLSTIECFLFQQYWLLIVSCIYAGVCYRINGDSSNVLSFLKKAFNYFIWKRQRFD